MPCRENSDVEQREGRIIRQGNLNERVRIYRYVTEASFDAYIWQTLETKARFIAQVMQGDTGLRSIEEVELAALSYAEVKALASGNPLVLEKAGIDTELAKLTLLKSQWSRQLWENKRELVNLPSRIEHIETSIASTEKDIATRQNVSGNKFLIEVQGRRYTERGEAGKALLLATHTSGAKSNSVIGHFAGFAVGMKATIFEASQMFISGESVNYECGRADSAQGFVRVLENALNDMEQVLLDDQDYLARTEKRMADITVELTKSFDKDERLVCLLQRQREIEAILDLNKSENAAVDEVAEVA